MTVVEEARQIIEQLTPQLEAEGYTVYLEPPRQLLPSFMQDYTPDAIALRSRGLEQSRKNLAIEVKVEGRFPGATTLDLERRFAGARDWELRVYYARPAGRKDSLTQAPTQTIDTALSSIENLVSTDQLQAALLLGWATFEALGRALAPEKFEGPQSPERLVQVLANDGLVTPSEADTLRVLSKARNQLTHGDLGQPLQTDDFAKFIEILATLRESMNISSPT
jgi:uncharacterized protein YutE (UPF0331/DUF86 family)